MKLVMALCALALICSAGATGASTSLAAPSGLHAFTDRADAPVDPAHTYTQMPAFAWNPVGGASEYELQLSTNRTFSDGAVFVDRKHVQAPVTSVDMQVPWMTGQPYAFWVRVRALAGAAVSRWSSMFGFNTQWQELPRKWDAPSGLIRWKPVEGATQYDVWFKNTPAGDVHVITLTNVVDEREYWAADPAGSGTILWRVRAVRYVNPSGLPNGIHAESHGPYTPVFSTPMINKRWPGSHAIADRDSTPTKPAPTALMPGFAWTSSGQNPLSRVYVYSDRQCVNVVTVGSAVAGPAWAPRAGGDDVGDPAPGAVMADNSPLTTSEAAFGTSASSISAAAGQGTGGTAGTGNLQPPAQASQEPDAGHITLPDNGWPAGRYWWTVVPVDSELQDGLLPQDACEALDKNVWSFAMQSTPVVTTDAGPRASGLSGTRVTSASRGHALFTELPVITWTPALGAQGYQIELSRHLYPWVVRFHLESSVPSATLPLSKADVGTWYYRVRGLNVNLPGTANKMTWSKTVSIRISGDRYVVVPSHGVK